MSTLVSYADIEVGHPLPTRTFPLRRADLVRYAGASGDFNPIHWNERFAREVGLPDVIAHGMLTMATAVRVLTDWAGDPGAVLDYSVRFTRPVVVPDDETGALVQVEAVVAEKLDGGRIRVDITARCGEEKVLGMARAVLHLS